MTMQDIMADRKQFLNVKPADPELLRLLDEVSSTPVTQEQLREQRVSFAFGNAMGTESITKESVRRTAQHVLFSA